VKINNVLTFSSSLRRSTLAEVPGGGGGLLIQGLLEVNAAGIVLEIKKNCKFTFLQNLVKNG
jgi:hypothetical protein